jgi:hypothetical protein
VNSDGGAWWLVLALAVIAWWAGIEALRWRAMYYRLKRRGEANATPRKAP